MSIKNYLHTTLTSVPAPKTGVTGTLVVGAGKVVGVSTDVKDFVQAGDYVISITLQEARQVVMVKNQDKIEISMPFSDAVNEALVVVSGDSAKVLYMELTAVGDTTFSTTGVLKADVPKSFGQPNEAGSATKFVRPIVVDGATANVNVDITFHSNRIE